MPEPGEPKSGENEEVIENLQNALRKVPRVEHLEDEDFFRLINYLTAAGEKELVADCLNLSFYNVVRVAKKDLSRNPITHDIGHFDVGFTIPYLKAKQVMPDILESGNSIMNDVVDLTILHRTLFSDYYSLEDIYGLMGNAEGVQKMKELKELEVDEYGAIIRKEPSKEDQLVYKHKLEDFVEKADKNLPFKSTEERNAALEKLKIDIQNKIDAIK